MTVKTEYPGHWPEQAGYMQSAAGSCRISIMQIRQAGLCASVCLNGMDIVISEKNARHLYSAICTGTENTALHFGFMDFSHHQSLIFRIKRANEYFTLLQTQCSARL
jgi:hypothetical protein